VVIDISAVMQGRPNLCDCSAGISGEAFLVLNAHLQWKHYTLSDLGLQGFKPDLIALKYFSAVRVFYEYF